MASRRILPGPRALLALLLVLSCTREELPPPPPAGGEGACVTFSGEDRPGWSACLADLGAFVPEALERMELDRCLEAWSALPGPRREALIASGRIHVTRSCSFEAGAGQADAAVLLALDRPLDLNRSSAEDLAALPGIGPALAERILASRTTDGPFCRTGDLLRVQGIGPRTLERLGPFLEASSQEGEPVTSR